MPFKRSNTTCKKIQQPIKSFFYCCECQSPKTQITRMFLRKSTILNYFRKTWLSQKTLVLIKTLNTWYCLSKHTKFDVQRSWNHAWYCLSRHTKLGVQRPRNHAWYCLSKHTKFSMQRSWNRAIVSVNTCQISQGQQNCGTEAFNILHHLFLYFAKTILLSEVQNNKRMELGPRAFPCICGCAIYWSYKNSPA